MIRVERLTKRFGRIDVLRDVSVDFPAGQITALIGPNGSGKTTLIKCVLGLCRPTGGSILLDGQPVLDQWEYRRRIGYMPQTARFPENLTVRDVLRLVEGVRGRGGMPDPALVDVFGLNGDTSKRVSALSGGTRQKVGALIAAMFDPPVYILDEPTAGLDPVSSGALKQFIRRQRDRGKTIILSSHIASDIESLADRIVFLLNGEVLFAGSTGELKDSTQCTTLETAIPALMRKGEK